MKLSDEKLAEIASCAPKYIIPALVELQIRRQLGKFVGHKANCQLIMADNLINHDSRCLWLLTRKNCRCKKCTCGLSALLSKLKELEGV